MSEIFELTTDDQWRGALSVLRELRPELEIDAVIGTRPILMAQGFKLFGLTEKDQFVCVAGVAIQPHITRGSDFWVHDLVTILERRSHGLGESMMRFLEEQARMLGCSRLSVHTRVSRDRAQNFYQNHLGYERYAVVFQKNLR